MDGLEILGVAANGFGTFAGSIINKGAISAHGTAVYIADAGSSLFTGSITNAGVLTAAAGMGLVVSSIANGVGGTFAGSIVNTSAVSAEETGILIANVGA
jgi:hypothetical protein